MSSKYYNLATLCRVILSKGVAASLPLTAAERVYLPRLCTALQMMDWSNLWYDDLSGEAHLLIAPNSEHSLATGIPEVCRSVFFLLRLQLRIRVTLLG